MNLNYTQFFKNLPEIKTSRLILRKLKLSDAKDMYEYASDPQVSKYMVWDTHPSINCTKEFLKFVRKTYKSGGAESWAVTLRDSGKMIGTCGFYRIDGRHRNSEIGYAMNRKYWGQGLMTEAVNAVIEFGFKKLKLNRVQANCRLENKGSEKVMIKCGMKYEGIMRELVFTKGKFHDLKVYAVLKKDSRQ